MNDPRIQQALIALQQGDAPKAKALATQALSQDPTSVEAGILLAKTQMRLGENSLAVEVLQALLRTHPKDPDLWLNLSIAQKGVGDLEASLSAVEMSLTLRPDDALALNTLGLCALHLNRGDQALAAFDLAIQLQPNVAALHRHRGMVLSGLSRHPEARASFEHALKLASTDVASLNQLAGLHLRHDRPSETRKMAERVLKVKPSDSEALFFLARASAQLGDKARARETFEMAAKQDPSLLTPYGIWLIEEGEIARAADVLEKRLAQAPEDGMALYYLIETQGAPATEQQIEALERVVSDDAQLPESQAFANYALAKVRDKKRDFAAAFEAYKRANDRFFGLKLRHVHDLVGTIDQEVADAKRVYTAERLADLRSRGNPTTRPIFIIGMIRSGTTLLEQIVSSHSAVGGAGELRFWMEHGPAVQKDLGQLRAYADAYLELIDRLQPESERVTDKMPLNLRFLGLISSAFPNAKFLWIRRDPMDTCFSIYATPFTDPPIFSYNLQNIGHVYRKYDELMEHWQAVLPKGTLFELTYEDLVADQERVTREILEYCELPFEEACLHPEQNSMAVRTPSSLQVRKPVYASSVKRWKNYEPWLGDLKAGLGSAFSSE